MMKYSVQCSVGDPFCAIHGWGYCNCRGTAAEKVEPLPSGQRFSYEEIESRKRTLALASAMAALIEAGVKVDEIEIVIATDHSTIVRRSLSPCESKEEP